MKAQALRFEIKASDKRPKLRISNSPFSANWRIHTPLFLKRGAFKMRREQLHTRLELSEFRRELRRNLTPAEAFLWKHLKGKQLLRRRFTKQHSIGGFIVDFYCASEKLIIELDGEIHMNSVSEEYDEKRTAYLEQLGFKVIRFENKMVFDVLSSVLNEIMDNFNRIEKQRIRK